MFKINNLRKSTRNSINFLIRSKFSVLLLLVVLGSMGLKIYLAPLILKDLVPDTVYELDFAVNIVEDSKDEHRIFTYLPQSDERQIVFDFSLDTGTFSYTQKDNVEGLKAFWEGVPTGNIRPIGYKTKIKLNAVKFEISSDVIIPKNYPDIDEKYLEESGMIIFHHHEIQSTWNLIKPKNNNNLTDTITSIYNFIFNEIETRKSQAALDTVKLIQLKEGSPYSKALLFTALCRLNNLPSRIAGGLVLEGQSKEHWWNEVYIENRWIPFCTIYGYFAEIPTEFLKLYIDSNTAMQATDDLVYKKQFRFSKFLNAKQEKQLNRSDKTQKFNAMYILHQFGLDSKTSGVFLLFPLTALITAFFRNIIGLLTFGIFMPMLIAAACRYTGIWVGLTSFTGIVIIAALFHGLFEKWRIHKVPRMAAVITIITLMMIALVVVFGSELNTKMNLLAMFPVVILSFTADKLNNYIESKAWHDLSVATLSTIIVIILCYAAFSSALLRSIFATFPELILLVLLGQIWVGQWVGLRLMEHRRFRKLLQDEQQLVPLKEGNSSVMGLNFRNRIIVDQLNPKSLSEKADDKIEAKEAFNNFNVPCPDTLAIIENSWEIEPFIEKSITLEKFVIKPNRGSKGNGIVIITGKDKNGLISASNEKWSDEKLEQHLMEILNGYYSKNETPDKVLIEAIIEPHSFLTNFAPNGIADIRIILLRERIVAAMLRLPTNQSGGKSNLHQGAIGVGVNIETGITTSGMDRGKVVEYHPDSKLKLANQVIPHWDKLLSVAHNAQKAIPLGYAGVDICIDKIIGPLVLEINARPGIEIQNIRGLGLMDEFKDENLDL